MPTTELPPKTIREPRDWNLTHEIAGYFGEPKVDVCDEGTITTRYIMMEDGCLYRVRDGLPNCSSDNMVSTAHITTPALFVRDDGGIEPAIQREIMGMGYRDISISRELEWGEEGISLTRTAYNMLLIVNETIGDGEVDPQTIQFGGTSRGGILTIAAKGLASSHPIFNSSDPDQRIHIDFMNIRGSCFYNPLKPDLAKITDTLELGHMLYREPGSFVYLLGQSVLHRVLGEERSFDLGSVEIDPGYTKAAVGSLSSGTGVYVPYIPIDPLKTQGLIRIGANDAMGQRRVTIKGFSQHEGILIDKAAPQNIIARILGGHALIVSRRAIEQDLALYRAIAKLKLGGEVDFREAIESQI